MVASGTKTPETEGWQPPAQERNNLFQASDMGHCAVNTAVPSGSLSTPHHGHRDRGIDLDAVVCADQVILRQPSHHLNMGTIAMLKPPR